MGKKSKKGKSRAKQHHGKKKRDEQVAKKRGVKSTTQTQTDTPAVPQSTEPPIVQETTTVAPTTTPSTPTTTPTTTTSTSTSKVADTPIPPTLLNNVQLLTQEQYKLARNLCAPPTNQPHIFEQWSTDTKEDASKKRSIMEQLVRMDNAYPSGGLVGYVKNAKELLEKSQKGENPLEGWVPSVPDGEMFTIGTKDYDEFEGLGLEEMGKCGFALVAGGLGERLGYGGIKLGLPTELATETSYLQYYIETILAIQSRYSNNIKLPLCIMVSNDTSSGTLKLLEENNYFGMEKEQISIVQQGDGVPALMDNDAKVAMDSSDPYKIQAKPHGHGDIHALLHSQGVAQSWCKKGLEWVIFFQDTNGLAFHTLPLALGVSKKRGLIMNSIAVPRKGKQAVGGVTKLTKTSTGEERTINVEYNQLDPLLRANGYPDGDVNDEKTGFSPFPGNINQLLFQLKPYTQALERTKGAMPEFVNPKYADDAKTIFKKPTRLECMMQDFPTILNADESKHVGFTSIGAELCFSPVKNATADGVNLQSKGTAPGVAATGEADQYAAVRKIMTSIGCAVEDANEETFDGIKVVAGPEIVLKPSFVTCPAEYKTKFPDPTKIKISGRSSLVVKGGGVIIESLDLDGALVIECEEGASGVLKDLVVKNKGWKKVADTSNSSAEFIRIRGYHLDKLETKLITLRKDGTIEGYTPLKEKVDTKVDTKVNTKVNTRSLNAKSAKSLPKVKVTPPSTSNHDDVPDLSRPNTPEAVATDAQNCCCIC